MSVTITTPAEETMLTTVGAVEEELSGTVSPSKIERKIKAATTAIEKYCGRIFAQQSYQEVINGSDSDILQITHTPIVGTPTVLCDGVAITDFEVRDAEAGWLYRETGWARAAWVDWNIEATHYDSHYPVFAVSYTGGYKLPGEQDTTLPADIEEACIVTVVQWIKRGKRDLDVKSKKVGDFSLTYGGATDQANIEADAIPSHARALLPRRVV